MTFQKATKRKAKLRLGLVGPAGSGKTFTALLVARALGGKVAVGDTEHGSASKYADRFDFDVAELGDYHPQKVIDLIRAAEAGGYTTLILDSLSHFWSGTGGVLEQVDRITSRSRSGNAFSSGWREMSPVHNAMVDAILSAKVHIIATMRSKTEYVIEEDNRGKKIPRKVGMAPVQRDGMEYEFDIVGEMDWENTLAVSKTRCSALKGLVLKEPGEKFAQTIRDWLEDGAEAPAEEPKAPLPPRAPTQRETAAAAENGPDAFTGGDVRTYAEVEAMLREAAEKGVAALDACIAKVRPDVRSWPKADQTRLVQLREAELLPQARAIDAMPEPAGAAK